LRIADANATVLSDNLTVPATTNTGNMAAARCTMTAAAPPNGQSHLHLSQCLDGFKLFVAVCSCDGIGLMPTNELIYASDLPQLALTACEITGDSAEKAHASTASQI
jgi:hypothetical protein